MKRKQKIAFNHLLDKPLGRFINIKMDLRKPSITFDVKTTKEQRMRIKELFNL